MVLILSAKGGYKKIIVRKWALEVEYNFLVLCFGQRLKPLAKMLIYLQQKRTEVVGVLEVRFAVVV